MLNNPVSWALELVSYVIILFPHLCPQKWYDPKDKVWKLTSQKFFKTQSNIPIPIIIVFLKNIRHPLQNDTTLHKQIKAHAILSAFVVSSEQQLDKGGAEPVAKRNKGIGVFVKGDVTAFVFVETVEEGAPSREEGPETTIWWKKRF